MARAQAEHSAVPLSYAQEQMWAIYEMDHSSAAYSMPDIQWLQGELCVELLVQATVSVASSQHSLRTRYGYSEDGVPAQWVARCCEWEVPVSIKSVGSVAMVNQLLDNELQTPHALEVEVVRLMVVQLQMGSEMVHLVVQNMHHIAGDGVSTGVLQTQLGGAYSALVSGEVPVVPALSVQYADYAVWQRRWFGSGDRLEEQLGWWQQTLGGQVPMLELQPDFARPVTLSSGGGWIPVVFDGAQQLQGVCQSCSATEMHGGLALWAVLLGQHSGQCEVVVGVPYANRARAELQPVVGYFVNTLAVLVQLRQQDAFVGAVHSASKAMTAALDHGEVPFVKVVEAVLAGTARDTSRSPLYQTMFVWEEAGGWDADDARLVGVEVMSDDCGTASTDTQEAASGVKFEVELYLSPVGEQLKGGMGYNLQLYEESTVQQWAQRLVTLANRAIVQPQQLLSASPWVSTREEELVVERWNGTAAAYCTGNTAPLLFEQVSTASLMRAAVVFEGELVSYGELEQRTSILAHRLGGVVCRDSVVGLCLEKSVEEVVGMVGIMRAGGAYVPLDPKLPVERLLYLMAQCMCVAVVVQRRCADTLSKGRAAGNVLLVAEDDPGSHSRVSESCAAPAPGCAAYVLFTSGSTGQPKGVVLQHGSLINYIICTDKSLQLTQRDVVLHSTPFTFDASVQLVWCPLVVSACLVVAMPRAALDPLYVQQLLLHGAVTFVDMVPSVLTVHLDSVGFTLPHSVRELFVLGEACKLSLAEQVTNSNQFTKFTNRYGPAEATIASHGFVCTATSMSHKTSVPIGGALPNVVCSVSGSMQQQSNSALAIGAAGELELCGVQLARGYISRPDLTAKSFVHNKDQRLYATGDRVRWLPSGDLEFLGRVDFQIKLNGQRIEAGEIEGTILQLATVTDAVVMLRHSPDRLVAYVRPNTVQPSLVIETCMHELPAYMVPSLVVPLDKWPLNSSGKLDREQLPEPIEQYTATSTPCYSGDLVEVAVAEACAHVLHLKPAQLNRDTSLLRYGLNSLQATVLHQQLHKHGLRGVKSVATVLQHPSISGLAGLLHVDSIVDQQQQSLEDALGERVRTVLQLTDAVPMDAALSKIGLTMQLATKLCLQIVNELHIFIGPVEVLQLDSVIAIVEHVEGV